MAAFLLDREQKNFLAQTEFSTLLPIFIQNFRTTLYMQNEGNNLNARDSEPFEFMLANIFILVDVYKRKISNHERNIDLMQDSRAREAMISIFESMEYIEDYSKSWGDYGFFSSFLVFFIANHQEDLGLVEVDNHFEYYIFNFFTVVASLRLRLREETLSDASNYGVLKKALNVEIPSELRTQINLKRSDLSEFVLLNLISIFPSTDKTIYCKEIIATLNSFNDLKETDLTSEKEAILYVLHNLKEKVSNLNFDLNEAQIIDLLAIAFKLHNPKSKDRNIEDLVLSVVFTYDALVAVIKNNKVLNPFSYYQKLKSEDSESSPFSIGENILYSFFAEKRSFVHSHLLMAVLRFYKEGFLNPISEDPNQRAIDVKNIINSFDDYVTEVNNKLISLGYTPDNFELITDIAESVYRNAAILIDQVPLLFKSKEYSKVLGKFLTIKLFWGAFDKENYYDSTVLFSHIIRLSLNMKMNPSFNRLYLNEYIEIYYYGVFVFDLLSKNNILFPKNPKELLNRIRDDLFLKNYLHFIEFSAKVKSHIYERTHLPAQSLPVVIEYIIQDWALLNNVHDVGFIEFSKYSPNLSRFFHIQQVEYVDFIFDEPPEGSLMEVLRIVILTIPISFLGRLILKNSKLFRSLVSEEKEELKEATIVEVGSILENLIAIVTNWNGVDEFMKNRGSHVIFNLVRATKTVFHMESPTTVGDCLSIDFLQMIKNVGEILLKIEFTEGADESLLDLFRYYSNFMNFVSFSHANYVLNSRFTNETWLENFNKSFLNESNLFIYNDAEIETLVVNVLREMNYKTSEIEEQNIILRIKEMFRDLSEKENSSFEFDYEVTVYYKDESKIVNVGFHRLMNMIAKFDEYDLEFFDVNARNQIVAFYLDEHIKPKIEKDPLFEKISTAIGYKNAVVKKKTSEEIPEILVKEAIDRLYRESLRIAEGIQNWKDEVELSMAVEDLRKVPLLSGYWASISRFIGLRLKATARDILLTAKENLEKT